MQEQGEVSSAGCFSDIPQSVLLNLNFTAEKSYFNGNETESCQSSQSGMMSAPSTELRGEEKSMSSAGVFLAKTLALLEKERELKENEADFGRKWPESLAKYDQITSSWRTHQCLLFEESTESLEIFPNWGIMQNGELWELAMLEGITNDYEFGLSQTYPTPTRRDTQGPMGKAAQARKGNPMDTLPNVVGGVPHPHLSEWLMGWPIGWTDLEPLEMDKFHLWLQQHGEFLEENK